jgi:hypothetical protein
VFTGNGAGLHVGSCKRDKDLGKFMETEMEKRTNERFVVRQLKNRIKQERSYPYRVVNLSKTGCAIESKTLLEKQDGTIFLDLPLPSKTPNLSLEAKVVWKTRLEQEPDRPSFLYGVRFEEMDNLSGQILDAYLGFLRRDTHIAQLEHAWEKLKKVQERIEVMIACEEKKEASYMH